jgi:5'(3')-deoxyribonucleotidase
MSEKNLKTKSMKKPIIAIDIDEVLADGTLSICEQINDLNGTRFTPEDWHAEDHEYDDFYANFPRKKALKYGIESLKSDMTVDQSHVPLKSGSKDPVRKISQDFKIILLTARDLTWKDETYRWVNEHFGEYTDQILFSKEHPKGPQKVDICEFLGVSYLIDDRIDYLKPSHDSLVTRILFGEYAWHAEIPEDIFHFKSWVEVEEYFERKFKD